MEFDSAPTQASLDVMKTEVADLLKASGITFNWRMAKENHGSESFAGLVMLKFRGTCRADWWLDPHNDFGSAGETHALGITKVSHGHVLPYSEVECDEIRQALQYLGPGAGLRERQKALGLALGRVVAHELYHILAKTTGHAARGLAKASHSLEELVSPPSPELLEADSAAMSRALR